MKKTINAKTAYFWRNKCNFFIIWVNFYDFIKKVGNIFNITFCNYFM